MRLRVASTAPSQTSGLSFGSLKAEEEKIPYSAFRLVFQGDRTGMLNKNLPPGITADILITAFAIIGLFEWSVANARAKAAYVAAPKIDRAYCTSCHLHADATLLRRMKHKMGNFHFAHEPWKG